MPIELPEVFQFDELHVTICHADVQSAGQALAGVEDARRARRVAGAVTINGAASHAAGGVVAIVKIIGGRVRFARPHVHPFCVEKNGRLCGHLNGRLPAHHEFRIRCSLPGGFVVKPAIESVAADILSAVIGRINPAPCQIRCAGNERLDG